jgi:hypothetical protein
MLFLQGCVLNKIFRVSPTRAVDYIYIRSAIGWRTTPIPDVFDVIPNIGVFHRGITLVLLHFLWLTNTNPTIQQHFLWTLLVGVSAVRVFSFFGKIDAPAKHIGLGGIVDLERFLFVTIDHSWVISVGAVKELQLIRGKVGKLLLILLLLTVLLP